MRQEEEYWALKSQLNWVAYGDHNTSFFHVSTLVRRHRNKIKSINTLVREWIIEEGEVKIFIMSGYREIFETSHLYSTSDTKIENFSCCFLSDEDKELLNAPVTEGEIKLGLWAFNPFKAPGVDRLHAGFFQIFWPDVKSSVCKEISNIFVARAILEYLNETLICLILKCQSPESLCNSIYKVVSKIIVALVRPPLDKLISQIQAAFVPRRKGFDNIIIAQELIHSLDN